MAGDQLIYKCPTWKWAAGEQSKAKAYLPRDKQYLITQHVPCQMRVAALEENYEAETEVAMELNSTGEDTWLATHCNTSLSKNAEVEEELEDISVSRKLAVASLKEDTATAATPVLNILGAVVDSHFSTPEDEYADLSTFEEDNLVEDVATLPPSYVTTTEPLDNEETLVKTRTYDLSISYDKYYQTPRVWLFGYTENNQPLTSGQIFEDIMQDYAHKTVTIEAHPHLNGVMQASIHPCQHAAVMKNIVANLGKGGNESTVGTYLFIFLKFIQSVIPTIDYDYTIQIEGKA